MSPLGFGILMSPNQYERSENTEEESDDSDV